MANKFLILKIAKLRRREKGPVVARESGPRPADSRVDWLKIAAYDEAGVEVGTKILRISCTLFRVLLVNRADKPCLHIPRR